MGGKCCSPATLDETPTFNADSNPDFENLALAKQVSSQDTLRELGRESVAYGTTVPDSLDGNEVQPYVPINIYATSNDAVDNEPPRMLIVGPPGAGKGTQSQKLIEKFGVVHLSTGDMLRAAVAKGTEIGKKAKAKMDAGEILPDDIVIGLIRDRILREDCQQKGFLLDGFPRTLVQAKALDEILGEEMKLTHVINLQVSDEILSERILGRRVHPASGRSYHTQYNPPKVEGVDDVTGETLIQRDDDTAKVLGMRMKKFEENTKPVLDYYRPLQVRIDGSVNDQEEVWHRIKKALTPALPEPKQEEDENDEISEDSPTKRVMSELVQRLSVRNQVPLLPYRPKSTKKVVELTRNNTDAEQSDLGEVLSEKTDDPSDGAFHIMDPRSMINVKSPSISVTAAPSITPGSPDQTITDTAWDEYEHVPNTAKSLVDLIRLASTHSHPEMLSDSISAAQASTPAYSNVVTPSFSASVTSTAANHKFNPALSPMSENNAPPSVPLTPMNSVVGPENAMVSPASDSSAFGKIDLAEMMDSHNIHDIPSTPALVDVEMSDNEDLPPMQPLEVDPVSILRSNTFKVNSETQILIEQFQEDHSELTPELLSEFEESDIIFLLHNRVVDKIKSPADVANVLIEIQHSINLIETWIPEMKELLAKDEEGAAQYLTHLVQELLKRASAEGLLKGVQQDWSKWKGANINDKVIENDIRQMVQYMAWLKNNIRASASVDYNDAQFAKEASLEIKEVLKSLLQRMKTMNTAAKDSVSI